MSYQQYYTLYCRQMELSKISHTSGGQSVMGYVTNLINRLRPYLNEHGARAHMDMLDNKKYK